jgi:hypothetical protein
VWLPLTSEQRVGDLKRLIANADTLEPNPGQRLLEAPEQLASSENHELMHDGEALDDEATLGDSGIDANSVVHLLVRRSAKITVRHVGVHELEVNVESRHLAPEELDRLQRAMSSGRQLLLNVAPQVRFSLAERPS